MIAFGVYRLDRSSGRLLRAGKDVRLRLKTFEVLEYLATRPGRLVSKDELLDAIWPDTHVTPSVLTGCIRELRRALGDDARAARFVETAYRRGYRFVAAAVTCSAPGASAEPPVGSRGAGLDRASELADLVRHFVEAVAAIVERAGRERPLGASVHRRALADPERPLRDRRGTNRREGLATRRS